MKKFLVLLPALSLVLFFSAGCATKEYVAEELRPLSERISKLEAQGTQKLDQDVKQANEAAQKAEAAAKSAEAAAKSAEAAAKQAAEAAKKAETAAAKAGKEFELMQKK